MDAIVVKANRAGGASRRHDDQPGWTMVGARFFEPEATRRSTEDVMPSGVNRRLEAGALPTIYRQAMLKGREPMAKPQRATTA